MYTSAQLNSTAFARLISIWEAKQYAAQKRIKAATCRYERALHAIEFSEATSRLAELDDMELAQVIDLPAIR